MPRKTYNNFALENERLKLFHQYREPHKLNKCKYELISFGIIRCSIVTEIYNREDILVRLIKMGLSIASPLYNKDEYPNSFKIWVTENGIKELLICSRIHVKFIKYLLK